MAFQDSDASMLGSLGAIVVGAIILNSSVIATGSLSSSADGMKEDGSTVRIKGVLTSVAEGVLTQNVSVGMLGTLSSTNQTVMYNDAYVSMYGFLSSTVSPAVSIMLCADITVDMAILELEINGCKIGESMEIKRYRGDTYPLRTKLGRNGNFNTAGITFKMSTKIADGTIHTSTGIIKDAVNGIVEFGFDVAAVATAGSGVYDIQGEDGYIYTYDKGPFILLEDVTV